MFGVVSDARKIVPTGRPMAIPVLTKPLFLATLPLPLLLPAGRADCPRAGLSQYKDGGTHQGLRE